MREQRAPGWANHQLEDVLLRKWHANNSPPGEHPGQGHGPEVGQKPETGVAHGLVRKGKPEMEGATTNLAQDQGGHGGKSGGDDTARNSQVRAIGNVQVCKGLYPPCQDQWKL